MATVPRLLNLFIKPCVVYPLFGFHDRIHRAIMRMTGVRFFTHLFGDSSFIVYYLRWLGYDLGEVEQTGSNFGMEVGHETPYLSIIGSGTMVADGLSIMNADFSSHVLPGLAGVYRAATASSGTTSPIRLAAGQATTA